MEREPVNFDGSVDTSLPSKPRWHPFIPIGIFIAAILFHSLIIFFYLPPVQTDFMREEDHLWESTRASRQFLRASFKNRGEGHFNEAAHLSAMAAAAAPWNIDSRRLSNLSFGTAGFVERALRVVFPLTASRRFDRAALYIEAGKADEAAKIMQQLIDEGYEFKRDYYQSAEPVMLEEEIISVFRKLSEQSQNDVDRLYDYGVVLRQFGFHSQALRVQREGQVLDASNPRIKQEISFLEKILLLPKKREGKRSNGLEKSP